MTDPTRALRPHPTPAEGPDPYGNPDAEPEWLSIDWREHLRDVEAEGTPVHYVELGHGPDTLLFVHGLSGSWQNWLEQIPHLSRAHRVLALDLPGFGASPMPPWAISIEAYGRLVSSFLDVLGVERSVLVGSSMGGFIAAEAAIRDPDRFGKLVLVSAAGISSAVMRKEPADAMARVLSAAAPLGLRWQERALLRPGLRELAFRQIVRWPLKLRRELLWEQFMHGAAKPGFLPSIQGLVGYDIHDRLEDVEIPTLIVWGHDDRVIPSADAAGYGERLRNSETFIFGDTGHQPQLERPVRFNRILEAFLSR